MDIVSESFPHLEGGVMADFQMIMRDRGYWNSSRWHDTKHMYTFETGTTLRFKSIDTYGKAHGPRRDVLFINECNNLEYSIVDQLIVRTREIVWLDWNPSEEFWFYTELQPKRDDIDFITLTYLDNEALDPITVAEIESHKGNKAWWTVYGLGQLGATESRVYRNWTVLDDIPEDALLARRGLDYGYTNDPSAAVDVYKYNRGYLFDEVLYRKGLSNKTIADILLPLPDVLTIGDSSEPKSNDELALYGVNIIGAVKGPGSVNQGIQLIQNAPIYVTRRSVNLIRESRNYLWLSDNSGKITNTPQDFDNHALDAARYAVQSLNPVEKKKDTTPYVADDPIYPQIGL